MPPIDVLRLARTGGRLEGECELAALPRLGASLARRAGTLAWSAQGLLDDQGRPALRLALHGLLPLRCDRCSAELAFVLEVERLFYFVASEAELAAIEIDDAPEEALLASERFDLQELIEDEAILQLPLSPRHDGCAPPPEVAAGAAALAARPNPFAQLQALREQLAGSPPEAPEGGSDGPKTHKSGVPRGRNGN
jgi:uncharacterized protein